MTATRNADKLDEKNLESLVTTFNLREYDNVKIILEIFLTKSR